MGLFSDAAPAVPSPIVRLQAGQTLMPRLGWYWVQQSAGGNVQRFDPRAQVWRYSGDDNAGMNMLYFDGLTTRLANTTGCAVAAVVTTAGSGYTTPPSVTPSAGASVWTAIVGGAISTAAVIGTAGSGYQYPPVLWIEQPPATGVQATGYVTLTNGSISAVTIDGQGAGYIAPPAVAIINDWRDTVGGGGQVSVNLTGAGTITAVVCTNHGNPITSGTVPTLAFGSGSAAATIVMDWCITSVGITTAGAGYTSAVGALTASGAGGYVTATPAYLGTDTSLDMTRWRPAQIDITTTSGGGMSAVGAIIDAGRYQGIPTPVITAAQPGTGGVLAFTMGGINQSVFLMPAQQ